MTIDTDTATPVRPNARAALIDNVDVNIETFLGAATMTVSELNALNSGAVVTLDASLSDLVDLRVNGVSVARGEIVAVGDKFGVRITSIAP